MSEIELSKIEHRSDIPVEVMTVVASDTQVIAAARVSTLGMTKFDTADTRNGQGKGLINFLVKNRHGSPFEHNLFTFRVTAPIFVWREHMRHRIGFSYNEESGRYKKLDPVFYTPGPERKLVQEGKAGAYDFVEGSPAQKYAVEVQIKLANMEAYESYERMLHEGVAREVARMVLPVNIYSTAYVTCNARSLMNFLSLRTKDETSTFPSFPQREIEMVAEQYEMAFSKAMPLTYAAFQQNGRVAP